MADELVSADKAESEAARTSLVPRNAFINEAMLAEALANHAHFQQRDSASKLRYWWRMIYRHKLMIFAVMLLIVPLVAIQAYRPTPYYEAVALIDVEEDPIMMMGKRDMYWTIKDNVKGDIEILKSRPVLERTVVRLKLDHMPQFLGANKRRTVWEAIRALSGTDIERGKKVTQLGRLTATGSDEKDSVSLDESLFDPARVRAVAEREKLAPYLDKLSSGLRVEALRDTQLLRVYYTHTDPEIAALVANNIALSFVDHNYETKTKRFTKNSGFLEESTRKLKTQVEQAEQRLNEYSRTHNIYTSDGKEDLATNKLAELHTQVMKAETDLILKEALYKQVEQGAINELPEAFADPKTAEMRKELNELSVNAAQLSVRFGPKHPKLLEIRQQMAVIQEQVDANRTLLADKLKADYERAQREVQSLNAALETAKVQASKQSQANLQFDILKKDLDTAKTLHTEFLNRMSQASVQKSEQFNNVRMVESAEPPNSPKGPQRLNFILAGLIGSLVLGIGLAWLRENLNSSVRNMEDITRATGLPTLAVIPTLDQAMLGNKERKAETRLLPDVAPIENALAMPHDLTNTFLTDEYSTAAEAYRMLRTSVLLSTAGHPPRTILVTSGQPGDGKTTTVFNTAIAFTQLDAEVLVLDCDMRKPRMHKVAQMDKGKGLSNFLSSGSNLDELIRPTGVPHLSIMSSGPIPPNPSELISSGKMKELLARLEERFDYILIDSPPVVTVTDPMILSTLVDGVILVAKSSQTKTEVLRRAYQDLNTVGAKVLGVILNDFDMQRENYDYYYYYRYSYDYSESARNGAS